MVLGINAICVCVEETNKKVTTCDIDSIKTNFNKKSEKGECECECYEWLQINLVGMDKRN